jgi:2-acylglycerol O-acyltransferase 2
VCVCVLQVGVHFDIPLWREFIMAMGFVDVSRESIQWLLSAGKSVVVVTGGALEALEAKPGVCRLVIEKRRGLIQLALEHGARLVPAYTWGENELWNQVSNPPGSLLRGLQTWFKDLFKWSPVVVSGRGIFQYSWGVLPFRRKLTTVLGKPLELPRIVAPTEEDIREWQGKYIDALQELYERHNSALHEELDHQGRRVGKAHFEIVG